MLASRPGVLCLDDQAWIEDMHIASAPVPRRRGKGANKTRHTARLGLRPGVEAVAKPRRVLFPEGMVDADVELVLGLCERCRIDRIVSSVVERRSRRRIDEASQRNHPLIDQRRWDLP